MPRVLSIFSLDERDLRIFLLPQFSSQGTEYAGISTHMQIREIPIVE